MAYIKSCHKKHKVCYIANEACYRSAHYDNNNSLIHLDTHAYLQAFTHKRALMKHMAQGLCNP